MTSRSQKCTPLGRDAQSGRSGSCRDSEAEPSFRKPGKGRDRGLAGAKRSAAPGPLGLKGPCKDPSVHAEDRGGTRRPGTGGPETV